MAEYNTSENIYILARRGNFRRGVLAEPPLLANNNRKFPQEGSFRDFAETETLEQLEQLSLEDSPGNMPRIGRQSGNAAAACSENLSN